jgi:hypothetical protein
MATIYNVDFLSKKLLSVQKETSDPIKERTQESFDKQAFFNRCLAQGRVAVTFDAKYPTAVIPTSVGARDIAVITFSTNFAIADVSSDDFGISQTLSFGGDAFKVTLPWECIYSISLVSGTLGREWNAGIPKDLPALSDKVHKPKTEPDPAV